MRYTSKTIDFEVPTVNDFPIDGLKDGQTIIVTEEGRGGIFVYDSTKVDEHNDGTNFHGWLRQYGGAINVKWFGAKGDGVADDTVAIQKAINSYSNIEISSGTYLLNSALNVTNYYDNIKIVGTCATLKIASEIYSAFKLGLKVVDASGFDTVLTYNNTGLTISGITFEAETEDSTSMLCAIYAYKNVLIKNCSFIGFKVEGLYIGAGCENVTIDNCFFKETLSTSESKGLTLVQYSPDYQSLGIDNQSWEYLTKPTTQLNHINITNCVFERTRIQVSNVNNINISGCTFKESAVRGINLSPWVTDFQVIDNNFTMVSSASTHINVGHACFGGTITNNIFTDSVGGSRSINLYYGVEDITIFSNLFKTGCIRDIALANKVNKINILNNTFASLSSIGETIKINSIDYYSSNKDIANTATDDKMNSNIVIKNNTFRNRVGKYIQVNAEINSNATPKELPIYNVSILNNTFYYTTGYFPATGDAFIILLNNANINTINIAQNDTLLDRNTIRDYGHFDMYILNTARLLNQNISQKKALYKVDIISGAITTTLMHGNHEITPYVTQITVDTLRVGGRYLGSVPIAHISLFMPDSVILRVEHKTGTANDGDYSFYDQSNALIDFTTTDISFYVVLETTRI